MRATCKASAGCDFTGEFLATNIKSIWRCPQCNGLVTIGDKAVLVESSERPTVRAPAPPGRAYCHVCGFHVGITYPAPHRLSTHGNGDACVGTGQLVFQEKT